VVPLGRCHPGLHRAPDQHDGALCHLRHPDGRCRLDQYGNRLPVAPARRPGGQLVQHARQLSPTDGKASPAGDRRAVGAACHSGRCRRGVECGSVPGLAERDTVRDHRPLLRSGCGLLHLSPAMVAFCGRPADLDADRRAARCGSGAFRHRLAAYQPDAGDVAGRRSVAGDQVQQSVHEECSGSSVGGDGADHARHRRRPVAGALCLLDLGQRRAVHRHRLHRRSCPDHREDDHVDHLPGLRDRLLHQCEAAPLGAADLGGGPGRGVQPDRPGCLPGPGAAVRCAAQRARP